MQVQVSESGEARLRQPVCIGQGVIGCVSEGVPVVMAQKEGQAAFRMALTDLR
jgi:hypothetical protein